VIRATGEKRAKMGRGGQLFTTLRPIYYGVI